MYGWLGNALVRMGFRLLELEKDRLDRKIQKRQLEISELVQKKVKR